MNLQLLQKPPFNSLCLPLFFFGFFVILFLIFSLAHCLVCWFFSSFFLFVVSIWLAAHCNRIYAKSYILWCFSSDLSLLHSVFFFLLLHCDLKRAIFRWHAQNHYHCRRIQITNDLKICSGIRENIRNRHEFSRMCDESKTEKRRE